MLVSIERSCQCGQNHWHHQRPNIILALTRMVFRFRRQDLQNVRSPLCLLPFRPASPPLTLNCRSRRHKTKAINSVSTMAPLFFDAYAFRRRLTRGAYRLQTLDHESRMRSCSATREFIPNCGRGYSGSGLGGPRLRNTSPALSEVWEERATPKPSLVVERVGSPSRRARLVGRFEDSEYRSRASSVSGNVEARA